MKTYVGIGGNGRSAETANSGGGGGGIEGDKIQPYSPKPLYAPDAPHPYGDAVKALARLYRHAEDIKDEGLRARVERATRELLGGEVDCGNDDEEVVS